MKHVEESKMEGFLLIYSNAHKRLGWGLSSSLERGGVRVPSHTISIPLVLLESHALAFLVLIGLAPCPSWKTSTSCLGNWPQDDQLPHTHSMHFLSPFLLEGDLLLLLIPL
jgi:hypothetical protein